MNNWKPEEFIKKEFNTYGELMNWLLYEEGLANVEEGAPDPIALLKDFYLKTEDTEDWSNKHGVIKVIDGGNEGSEGEYIVFRAYYIIQSSPKPQVLEDAGWPEKEPEIAGYVIETDYFSILEIRKMTAL